MPTFAQALPEDNKFTKKGWVIIFCDPTLPEAGDKLLEGTDPDLGPDDALAPSRSDEGGDFNDEDLDF